MAKHLGNAEALPTADQIRLAVSLYLKHAYGPNPPASTAKFALASGVELAHWLMSDLIERDPPNAPLAIVRSFALRMGNSQYPHAKLRLSRPPNHPQYLFTVDSHDVVLRADPGTPDFEALRQLKSFNARAASAINEAWEAAGLPTEHGYLRQKIREARSRNHAGERPSTHQP